MSGVRCLPTPGARVALRRAAGVALAAVAALPATASAVALPDRTFRVSTPPPPATAVDGASRRPAVSLDGRTVTFDTTATTLAPGDANGAIDDVVAVDLVTGVRRLVSEAPGGGNGASVSPAISGNGQIIVFASLASNLVAGDTNGVADIFVRDGRKPIVRITVGIGGAQSDGSSYQPDISSDGRYVAFVSEAGNLVPGDVNGKPDVFVRDLATGRTELASRSADGEPGDARSSQPAISGDGQVVAFESAATNLSDKDDTNGIADVFVRDLRTGETERVSVTTAGRQQNRSVIPPFTIQPDISRDGRFVVYESDATNLSPGDTNKRTDVFLRDRARDTTRLISASTDNVQGNNDSFAPRITPNGRFVAFASFASNLVPAAQDAPREDVFVRDLVAGRTTNVTVTNSGLGRLPEAKGQNLERPAPSADARAVVFASSVPNFVEGDANGDYDVFVRRMDAPETTIVRRPTKRRRSVSFGADERRASSWLCRLDQQVPFLCGPTLSLRRRIGRVLRVAAGGPGMLFDSSPESLTLSRDRRRPSVRVSPVRTRSLRVIRGRASDRGGAGLAKVEIAVARLVDPRRNRCQVLTAKGFVTRGCGQLEFVRVRGARSWRLRLPKSVRGVIGIVAVATDYAGNTSRPVRVPVVLR